MAKKHIDSLSLKEIDYAVAVAQGWSVRSHDKSGLQAKINNLPWWGNYSPTTNQAQCGELIDEFEINTLLRRLPSGKTWQADISGHFHTSHNSRLVAVCRTFLWTKHPDGMIEVQDATTI